MHKKPACHFLGPGCWVKIRKILFFGSKLRKLKDTRIIWRGSRDIWRMEMKEMIKNGSTIEGIPLRFFECFIVQSLHIHVIKPGHLIFSMKLPPCLQISGNHFHGGATAVLVDLVGSAVIFTVGAPQTSVSVKMTVSYLNAAYADAPSR